MGISNAIYFNSKEDLPAMVEILSSYLKLSFIQTSDGGETFYKTLILGVEVLLSDKHEMVDDGPLHFSGYKYELFFRGWYRHVSGLLELQRAMAFFSYKIITETIKWPAMLVEDSQLLIEQTK